MILFLPGMTRSVGLICWFARATSVLLLVGLFGQCPAFAEGSVLQPEDCGKCHGFQQKMLAEAGGRHAADVGCLDCHPQHPPNGEKTVAACSDCHFEQAHDKIDGCLNCHANPHKPLVSLRDPLKPARRECLSCHAGVGEEMNASASRHAQLYCNRCHSRHTGIPACLDCHPPHLQTQSSADCLRCHPAHRPLEIEPAGYVPGIFCQACHPVQANALADTNTNHGGINCAYCHQGPHRSIPACHDCHGLPHARSIHGQYRNCLDCHGDAHRLISNR